MSLPGVRLRCSSVNGRLWGAGSYLPQFGLYGLTIASAVFLFDKKTPY